MDDNCGEWVECMDVASGCGCKEVYRFPHTTYPYSCICSFCSSIPTFSFFLNVFHSFRRKKKKNAKSRFFTSARYVCKLAMLYTHSIENQR